ncbi:hypothetical protein [Burkholderia glumae]|uniref:hypothetical protein n=1 Tax=Burkholderia glumae TaxID=337 RepID=UPI0021503859|nr:hypothetical protein [Burkholderia glumae]
MLLTIAPDHHDTCTPTMGAPAASPALSVARTPSRPADQPWFDAFVEGFRLWTGDDGTPRDPDRAVPLLCDAARLGHGGSALLLANVFDDLAQDAAEHEDTRTARTFTRLSIVYRTAAFWSNSDDPSVELDHESKADWDVARAAPREPRLWDAIDAMCGRSGADHCPDPSAAMRGFEALAEDHPVHAGLLASVAAEEAAECSQNPSDARALMERARAHLLRSASAGNRAAQKRLFVARAGATSA